MNYVCEIQDSRFKRFYLNLADTNGICGWKKLIQTPHAKGVVETQFQPNRHIIKAAPATHTPVCDRRVWGGREN
jgi:hypothetical protein